jgi:hypothetical protein
MSVREAGSPPNSESGPERPGGEAAKSGEVLMSVREAGSPPNSESGPERPGGEAAKSGESAF